MTLHEIEGESLQPVSQKTFSKLGLRERSNILINARM
jgi:hypothetical protein